MTSLRRIHITGACLVGDVGLRWIIQHCLKLEDVDLSYCNSITDQTLIEFGTHSKYLTSISLAGLGHVTDIGLAALAKGCPGLKKLNLTACNKITNSGIQSFTHLKKLESLHLSCCDLLSDEGILLFSSTIHSLRVVDVSNCDQISIHSISSLINSNPALMKFNCMGCNILSIDFNKITKYLPFAKAMTSKCRLESRHHSLIRYNSIIFKFNQLLLNVIKIQSIIRCWIQYKRYQKILLKRSSSCLTIQRVWRGYQSRTGTYYILKQQKLYLQQVKHLQKSLRRLHAISLSKAKKRYLLKRYRATRLLQRTVRGYLTRSKLYHYRFKSHRKYRTKIFYLSQKLFILRSVRKVHSQIIQIQSHIRRKICHLRYQILQLGVKKFQRLFRLYMSTKIVMNRLISELINELSVKEYAIEKIISCWRAKKYNAMICEFISYCAVVYRNEEDMKEWIYEQNTESAIKIQALYRGYKARVRFEIFKRLQAEGSVAIVILQKNIRKYFAQKKFISWRLKMKKISSQWRQVYRGVLAFYYRKQMKIISKILKLNVFRKQRERAAGVILRVYRGHQARKLVQGMIFEIHCGLAARIQRAWRNYQERQVRRFHYARRHIAVKRIQVWIPHFSPSSYLTSDTESCKTTLGTQSKTASHCSQESKGFGIGIEKKGEVN